jgi:hypothetical protein
LPGTRSAAHGQAAISRRTRPNAKPPTMAMCRPEIDRMWARPEARMASVWSWVIQASWPVTMAAAMPPRGGPMSSTIRLASRQRKALTAMAARSRQGGGSRSAGPD